MEGGGRGSGRARAGRKRPLTHLRKQHKQLLGVGLQLFLVGRPLVEEREVDRGDAGSLFTDHPTVVVQEAREVNPVAYIERDAAVRRGASGRVKNVYGGASQNVRRIRTK